MDIDGVAAPEAVHVGGEGAHAAPHLEGQGIALLDSRGNLTCAGYAKRLLPVYDRKLVKKSALRLKEWDYYYVGNSRFGVALTIADNGYMGLDSISFLFFEGEPWQVTKSPMRAFPMGRTNLPPRSMMGIDSCGMLLSAVHSEEGEEKLHLLMVDNHIPAGAKLY